MVCLFFFHLSRLDIKVRNSFGFLDLQALLTQGIFFAGSGLNILHGMMSNSCVAGATGRRR